VVNEASGRCVHRTGHYRPGDLGGQVQRSAWAWEARGVHAHDVYMKWAGLPTVCKLGPGVNPFF
jgi:hypothetical protein